LRIALDAMGSDRAPDPEVRGAVEATRNSDVEVVLVGDEARLSKALEAYPKRGKISIVHASQVIEMCDSPIQAVRQKKDSSLLVALRLVKEGAAAGAVSAGNTGAVMMASRTILMPIRGVSRSPICPMLPTTQNPVVLLDMGANVDCSARHLCDFAEMGMVYSKVALGVDNPRVGLLNIGEEQLKGNELAKTVHRNLTAAEHINFIGNVEPKAMYLGVADVVVCDGFVGNLVLKTSEGAALLIRQLLRRELTSTWTSKLGALLSRGAYRRLKRTIDANEHMGAPLLGVNGTVIILHGACTSKGVANAITGAVRMVECDIVSHIRAGIEELRQAEATLTHKDAAN
jgi:phosphate acyltransferase